ncbi:MAG: maltose/maltodextrin ABC transporter substrate-binding protein MalE [Calditrichia bacterium]
MVFLLLGCSTANRKKITIWTSLRPVEREYLQLKLDEFSQKYPQFQFQQLFYSPEELRTNFIISALAGKGPALVHCASDNIGPMSELKVIKPLEGLYSEAFLDSFMTEPFLANTWFNGHLYQIADRVGNHLCLVYNKKLVKEPPRTIAELIKMGKQFARDLDGDGRQDTYALAWNYTEPFFAVPFIGGFGGWILNEQNEPTLDSPAVARAAMLIYDLANVHGVIPKECDYETANALFLDGRVAMIINGPWSWGTYLKNGLEIGLARIPQIDETGLWPTPLVSPLGYCLNISLEGEKLKVATELVRFLTSDSVEFGFAKRYGIIPARKSLFHHPELRENPIWAQALDQMMVGRAMPVVTELRWIWDAMRPAYQGIFTGQISPEEAAKKMQFLALKLIRENRE